MVPAEHVRDEWCAEYVRARDGAAALQKLISDIEHVAEFGHPAIDRKDNAAVLEWIRGEIKRVIRRPQ